MFPSIYFEPRVCICYQAHLRTRLDVPSNLTYKIAHVTTLEHVLGMPTLTGNHTICDNRNAHVSIYTF